MSAHRPRRLPSRRKLATLCFAAAAVPWPALAVEKDWKTTVGSGSWSTLFPGNWLQGAIPAAGDDAYIVHNDAINRIVTYDYTGGPITLGSVHLDNTGAGTNTLSQSANVLSSTTEYVGFFGGGVHLQSGGANSASSFMDVGRFVGSTGLYNQTGGILSSPNVYIGDDGNGTFLQSGTASASVTGVGSATGLFLGYSATGSGARRRSSSTGEGAG